VFGLTVDSIEMKRLRDARSTYAGLEAATANAECMHLDAHLAMEGKFAAQVSSLEDELRGIVVVGRSVCIGSASLARGVCLCSGGDLSTGGRARSTRGGCSAWAISGCPDCTSESWLDLHRLGHRLNQGHVTADTDPSMLDDLRQRV
jgi:hypothetical protein